MKFILHIKKQMLISNMMFIFRYNYWFPWKPANKRRLLVLLSVQRYFLPVHQDAKPLHQVKG